MTRLFSRIAAAALTVALGAAATAQDVDKEKAIMEAWQKASTPQEPHRKLEPLVGTFDAAVRSSVDPTRPPEESTGTTVNSWVLGGRFVEQQYDGTFFGEPFNGIGYTGYDNVQKKYVSVWMDSAGTRMMFVTSTADKSGKILIGKSQVWDPATGKEATVESKTVIVDNDHHNFELWGKAPNGKPMKLMEIHYTRKK